MSPPFLDVWSRKGTNCNWTNEKEILEKIVEKLPLALKMLCLICICYVRTCHLYTWDFHINKYSVAPFKRGHHCLQLHLRKNWKNWPSAAVKINCCKSSIWRHLGSKTRKKLQQKLNIFLIKCSVFAIFKKVLTTISKYNHSHIHSLRCKSACLSFLRVFQSSPELRQKVLSRLGFNSSSIIWRKWKPYFHVAMSMSNVCDIFTKDFGKRWSRNKDKIEMHRITDRYVTRNFKLIHLHFSSPFVTRIETA